MPSVLQEWVTELPLMQQSVLLSAMRGCDGLSKHDQSKEIVRHLRSFILVDAKPPDKQGHSFMNKKESLTITNIENFSKDIDYYPVHFLMHLIHAIEIIGYKHPDEITRVFWHNTYFILVKALHLNIETEEQLNNRLMF